MEAGDCRRSRLRRCGRLTWSTDRTRRARRGSQCTRGLRRRVQHNETAVSAHVDPQLSAAGSGTSLERGFPPPARKSIGAWFSAAGSQEHRGVVFRRWPVTGQRRGTGIGRPARGQSGTTGAGRGCRLGLLHLREFGGLVELEACSRYQGNLNTDCHGLLLGFLPNSFLPSTLSCTENPSRGNVSCPW